MRAVGPVLREMLHSGSKDRSGLTAVMSDECMKAVRLASVDDLDIQMADQFLAMASYEKGLDAYIAHLEIENKDPIRWRRVIDALWKFGLYEIVNSPGSPGDYILTAEGRRALRIGFAEYWAAEEWKKKMEQAQYDAHKATVDGLALAKKYAERADERARSANISAWIAGIGAAISAAVALAML